jgi:hypothetical protein
MLLFLLLTVSRVLKELVAGSAAAEQTTEPLTIRPSDRTTRRKQNRRLSLSLRYCGAHRKQDSALKRGDPIQKRMHRRRPPNGRLERRRSWYAMPS